MTGCAALLNWRTASEGGPYKSKKNPRGRPKAAPTKARETREGGLKPPLQRLEKPERAGTNHRAETQEHSQEWLCHKEVAW